MVTFERKRQPVVLFACVFVCFFLSLRLNLCRGHQTGFGMQVDSIKEVNS